MHNNQALLIALLLSLVTGIALGDAQSLAGTTIEPDMDRGGSDYAGYNLPSPEPALCRKACDQDQKCKAYTYVKPGLQGPLARCYLKDAVPVARPNKCCVSGVKTAKPALQTIPSNQPRTQPAPAPGTASVVSAQPVAESPPILQLDMVARDAARQWATEALTRNIRLRQKNPSDKFRQLFSFSTNLQFSMVNPNLSSITVSIGCFGSDGKRASVSIENSLDKGTHTDREVTLAANGAALRRVALGRGEAIWCRALSDSPFLFSAWLRTEAAFRTPGKAHEREYWRTPIKTFVLVK